MITAFIENQFPVSKLSKESYKERKATQSQTITGLGKWWGRKPLVLVRATILGCLMPASDDPRRDMEIFLKIMSMDDNGLWQRHIQWEDKSDNYWHEQEKELYQNFDNLSYDEKLKACVRPEQFERPVDDDTWEEINNHLGTQAFNLQDLMQQLSEKRFGKVAVIGDCFCGGGSIPFEAARIGLDVYASDLNPIAGLLTWAAIHICGASDAEIAEIKKFQQDVYEAVDKEITELGIEHNENGDRALSYIYCVEVKCPECGVIVPMLPSLVVGQRAGYVVAKLRKNNNCYDIDIVSDVSEQDMKIAKASGTVASKGLVCPCCGKTTPIAVLRHDRKNESGKIIYSLRKWEKTEFEPRQEDTFKERLYCIRYEKISDDKSRTERYYRAPNIHDLDNEIKIHHIVQKNISKWQEQGLIPNGLIEPGDKTNELIRNRGWTYWNHLFNARQLLVLSKFVEQIEKTDSLICRVIGILGINKCVNFISKLSRLDPSRDIIAQTFYNQAFNTLMNYGVRSMKAFDSFWLFNIEQYISNSYHNVEINDARLITSSAYFWITDPPYADAVNYHELSEFFLAWDRQLNGEQVEGS